MVSGDGLAAGLLKELMAKGALPTFARLEQEGASTLAARTDSFNTTTIPNHTSMPTGLPVARVAGHPEMRGLTALIITADRGGVALNHADPKNRANFTIPFFLWGPGVPPGKDLYDIVTETQEPRGDLNPGYEAAPQPIRNGDLGNTALMLLGLPAIPGSVIPGLVIKTH
jgi:hypothetical protein